MPGASAAIVLRLSTLGRNHGDLSHTFVPSVPDPERLVAI
jgi:hypothetical protein